MEEKRQIFLIEEFPVSDIDSFLLFLSLTLHQT